jgi:uncharacterized cupredoxin-like copper-binding protein
MKTFFAVILVGVLSIMLARAQEDIPAKAAKAAATAAETAKHVGQAAVRHTKEAVETVADVFTPEPDARRVDVTLTDHHIDMASHLKTGKTAFVVKNTGEKKHNFEIEGEGVNKKFLTNLSPGQSKVLHVTLEHGKYTTFCPLDGDREGGMETKLTVR